LKRFAQARVNGGSNYDSLVISREIGGYSIKSIMPSSPSLTIGLQVPGLFLDVEGKFRLGDTTWYGEGFLFGES